MGEWGRMGEWGANGGEWGRMGEWGRRDMVPCHKLSAKSEISALVWAENAASATNRILWTGRGRISRLLGKACLRAYLHRSSKIAMGPYLSVPIRTHSYPFVPPFVPHSYPHSYIRIHSSIRPPTICLFAYLLYFAPCGRRCNQHSCGRVVSCSQTARITALSSALRRVPHGLSRR
jgi:hypothetical protein